MADPLKLTIDDLVPPVQDGRGQLVSASSVLDSVTVNLLQQRLSHHYTELYQGQMDFLSQFKEKRDDFEKNPSPFYPGVLVANSYISLDAYKDRDPVIFNILQTFDSQSRLLANMFSSRNAYRNRTDVMNNMTEVIKADNPSISDEDAQANVETLFAASQKAYDYGTSLYQEAKAAGFPAIPERRKRYANDPDLESVLPMNSILLDTFWHEVDDKGKALSPVDVLGFSRAQDLARSIALHYDNLVMNGWEQNDKDEKNVIRLSQDLRDKVEKLADLAKSNKDVFSNRQASADGLENLHIMLGQFDTVLANPAFTKDNIRNLLSNVKTIPAERLEEFVEKFSAASQAMATARTNQIIKDANETLAKPVATPGSAMATPTATPSLKQPATTPPSSQAVPTKKPSTPLTGASATGNTGKPLSGHGGMHIPPVNPVEVPPLSPDRPSSDSIPPVSPVSPDQEQKKSAGAAGVAAASPSVVLPSGLFMLLATFYKDKAFPLLKGTSLSDVELARLALMTGHDGALLSMIMKAKAGGFHIDANLLQMIEQKLAENAAVDQFGQQIKDKMQVTFVTSEGMTIRMPDGSPADKMSPMQFLEALDKGRHGENRYWMRYQYDDKTYTQTDGRFYSICTGPKTEQKDLNAHAFFIINQLKAAGNNTISFRGTCTPEFIDAIMRAYAVTPGMEINLDSLNGAGLSKAAIEAYKAKYKELKKNKAKNPPKADAAPKTASPQPQPVKPPGQTIEASKTSADKPDADKPDVDADAEPDKKPGFFKRIGHQIKNAFKPKSREVKPYKNKSYLDSIGINRDTFESTNYDDPDKKARMFEEARIQNRKDTSLNGFGKFIKRAGIGVGATLAGAGLLYFTSNRYEEGQKRINYGDGSRIKDNTEFSMPRYNDGSSNAPAVIDTINEDGSAKIRYAPAPAKDSVVINTVDIDNAENFPQSTEAGAATDNNPQTRSHRGYGVVNGGASTEAVSDRAVEMQNTYKQERDAETKLRRQNEALQYQLKQQEKKAQADSITAAKKLKAEQQKNATQQPASSKLNKSGNNQTSVPVGASTKQEEAGGNLRKNDYDQLAAAQRNKQAIVADQQYDLTQYHEAMQKIADQHEFIDSSGLYRHKGKAHRQLNREEKKVRKAYALEAAKSADLMALTNQNINEITNDILVREEGVYNPAMKNANNKAAIKKIVRRPH